MTLLKIKQIKKMKQLTIILTFTIMSVSQSFSQISDYSEFLNGTKQLTDISTLKTLNDFDQKNLTSEQINDKLSEIIKNSKSNENYFLEIPYNTKSLNYIGKKHPKDVLQFSNDAFTSRLGHINKEVELYTYDGIYISLPTKDAKSILNLFYTVRVLTILKLKYPEAYLRLLKQQQGQNATSYVAQDPYRKTPSFNKCNSIISFDNSPTYIAASTADLVYSSSNGIFVDGYGYYENTMNLVTSIDNETIYGNTEYGSKKVYGYANANENYFHYMRDGLLETIIHEFVHNYISSNTTIDKKAFFINEMRFDKVDTQFQNDVEEAIVLNTTLSYYMNKGGISSAVIKFYNDKLNEKKVILTSYFSNKINLQRYYALKALSEQTSNNFEDIYILDVLKNK